MKYFFLLYISLFSSFCFAQRNPDSSVLAPVVPDSVQRVQDSVARRQAFVQDSLVRRAAFVRDSVQAAELARFQRLVDSSRYHHNPFFRFTHPVRMVSTTRQWQGKEGLFYGIVAVLLFFGLIKSAFPRYLSDLFRTFFRTTIRQRLIKEQMAGNPLPSLLFNVLFLVSGSMLICLLLQHFGLTGRYPFWLLFLYCVAGLSVMYLAKFLTLKLFGWLLRISDATDTYIFIVFTTNKVLGILLLPLILGLAFAEGMLYETFFSLSLTLVGLLLVYRYYLSYISVHKLVRINFFHFIIYLLALEIIPLLLINKLLVEFFAETR